MIIAVLPALFAIVLAGVALGPGGSRATSWRASFSGIAVAGVALSFGILTDAFFAWQFFSGHVPFDAGSNPTYDLYRRSQVPATLVGVAIAICVLVCSSIAAAIHGKRSSPEGTSACGLLSYAVIGVTAVGLFAIRSSGAVALALLQEHSEPATVAEQLYTFIRVAAIASGSALMLSLGLYVVAFHAKSATTRSSWSVVLPSLLSVLLLAEVPSLLRSLRALARATRYSGYLPPP